MYKIRTYNELNDEFNLRPIKYKYQHQKAIKVVESFAGIVRGLKKDESEYLEVLVLLIEKYESNNVLALLNREI